MKSTKLKVTILALVLAAALALCLVAAAYASEVTVVLDGEVIESDVPARIEDNRTLIPMRAIFEALGMEVSWDDTTKTVTATDGTNTIELTIGEKAITVNGETIEIDTAAIIEDGTTLVPVRAVSESLNADVDWDAETKTVTITTAVDDSWKENTGTIDVTQMSVTGEGISVDGNVITITEGGDFEVTGENSDAMIYVNTKSRVKLRLSGVTLINTTGPAIFFENTDKAFITISKGTENYIADGAEYSVDAKAAVFSNDDLEIKGSGTLTVVSAAHHAIASDDDIKIEEGTLILTAAKDGIHANNTIKITGGSITITAEGDGIQAEEDVIVEDGEINITTTGEVAASGNEFGGMGGGMNMGMGGGHGGGRQQFTAGTTTDSTSTDSTSTDDTSRPMGGGGMQPMGESGDTSGEDGFGGGPGGMGGGQPGGEMPNDSEQGNFEPPTDNNNFTFDESADDGTTSSKGIKAETDVTISGGSITVNSNDHAIHSAATLTISGGTLNLTSNSKKGISAHGEVVISDGEINILKSTEGIESKADMTISGGTINIVASDDAINCGGTNGQDVRSSGGTTSTGHDLTITGGTIFVNSSGDGLDANGYIKISGGDIIVEGPTNSGNGALDSGADIIVDGGTMLAIGASGMAESPGSSSTQPSFSITQEYSAGTTITIKNSSGNVLYSYTTIKSGGSIIFTSPDLEIGETYTVTVGDTDVSVEMTSVSVNSGMGNMMGGGQGGMGGGQPGGGGGMGGGGRGGFGGGQGGGM